MPQLYEYSRSQNPSREVLEKTLASLDNAKYGLCFSSGLGAITVIVQLLKSGDHVLCIDDVYGGTNRFFNKIASKYNISVSFTSFNDFTVVDKEVRPNTKVSWVLRS